MLNPISDFQIAVKIFTVAQNSFLWPPFSFFSTRSAFPPRLLSLPRQRDWSMPPVPTISHGNQEVSHMETTARNDFPTIHNGFFFCPCTSTGANTHSSLPSLRYSCTSLSAYLRPTAGFLETYCNSLSGKRYPLYKSTSCAISGRKSSTHSRK